jgi:hypothetical protein
MLAIVALTSLILEANSISLILFSFLGSAGFSVVFSQPLISL